MSAAPDMLVQLTVGQLETLVRKCVRDELAERAEAQGAVFLRRAQVAELLNCSERQIARLIKLGLPAEKLGAEWRFEQAKVLEFMRERKVG